MPTEKCGTKTNQLINDSDDDVDIYALEHEAFKLYIHLYILKSI